MALRSAEWSVIPLASAFDSSCFQSCAGKRTDRGTVGPVSVPFLGRPRPTWTMPSSVTRVAYGFLRTRARSKSTSGISRRDAFDGAAELPVCPGERLGFR